MHGSPLSKYNNRDLWKEDDYHTYGWNRGGAFYPLNRTTRTLPDRYRKDLERETINEGCDEEGTGKRMRTCTLLMSQLHGIRKKGFLQKNFT